MTDAHLDEVALTYIVSITTQMLDLNQLEVVYDAFCTFMDRRDRARIVSNERFRPRGT